jgi:hypothetical protein
VEIGCGDGALLGELSRLAAIVDGFELADRDRSSPARAPGARRLEAYDGAHVPAGDGAYDLAVLACSSTCPTRRRCSPKPRASGATCSSSPAGGNRSAARRQARRRPTSATCTRSRAPACAPCSPAPACGRSPS